MNEDEIDDGEVDRYVDELQNQIEIYE